MLLYPVELPNEHLLINREGGLPRIDDVCTPRHAIEWVGL